MTAEFALVLPAAVLVLGACLGGLAAGALQVRLTDAAALVARSVARGDDTAQAAEIADSVAGASVAATTRADGLVCVVVAARIRPFGAVVDLPLRASGCALEQSDAPR